MGVALGCPGVVFCIELLVLSRIVCVSAHKGSLPPVCSSVGRASMQFDVDGCCVLSIGRGNSSILFLRCVK